MDLTRVRQFDHQFDLVFLTSKVVRTLEASGMVTVLFLPSTQTSIELSYSPYTNDIYFHIGQFDGEEDRALMEFSLYLSDGSICEARFWGYGTVRFVGMENLRALSSMKKGKVILKIGLYEGNGSQNCWKKVFQTIEDFTPVVFPPNEHSHHLDNLLENGKYSDVTLRCQDGIEISTHKCLLLSCPYFKALFSGHFGMGTKTIRVDFSHEIMKIILKFVYSGRIFENDVRNWQDLYIAADFYCLEDLVRHCELQMMVRAPQSIQEIKFLLNFAVKFHARKLRIYLVQVVRELELLSVPSV